MSSTSSATPLTAQELEKLRTRRWNTDTQAEPLTADQEVAQSEARRLIAEETALRATPSTSDRFGDPSARRAAAEKVWAPDRLEPELANVEANHKLLVDDPRIQTFAKAEQDLTWWNEIRVDGDRARVVVTGTSRYQPTGSQEWVDEGTMQWELDMIRAGDGYRLSEMVLKGEQSGP